MIDINGVARALTEQEEYVSQNHIQWKWYRDAFVDKYWKRLGRSDRNIDATDLADPVRVQINLIRPWVDSFVSSLFYKGIRTSVHADDVTMREEDDESQTAIRIAKILDRWLSTQNAEDLAELGFQMGLMYPESAYKLNLDTKAANPLEAIQMEIMPPWECVWDRKARSRKHMRFIGRLHWLSKETVERVYGVSAATLQPTSRPDVVKRGMKTVTPANAHDDESYVEVLEFYDLTAMHEIEGDEEEPMLGELRVYLVDQAPPGEKPVSRLWQVDKSPVPYIWADGRPMPPIVPIILANVLEFPMMGTPPVATVYEINSEINVAHTMMAQAFRRDLGRVLLVKKDALGESELARIQSGDDWVVVPVEEDALDGVTRWLDQQPVHSSLLTYLGMLNQGQEKTQTNAPLTRGQPLRYATATEVQQLTDYTETMLGRIRKRMDKIIGELCKMYLRMLEASMDEQGKASIKVRDTGEVFTINRKDLDKTWFVGLSDTAVTPASEQTRRAEFSAAAPQLIQLAQIASQGGELGQLAQLQMREIVKLYDLPQEMEWSSLQGAAQEEQVDQALEQLAAGGGLEGLAGGAEAPELAALAGGGGLGPLAQ